MKSKERKTKEKVELKLHFYKEDLISAFSHFIAIRAYIQRGQAVPAELLQKFLTVFEKPFTEDRNARLLVIETAKNYALRNLIPSQDFDLTVKRTEIKTKGKEPVIVVDMMRFEPTGIAYVSLTNFLATFFSRLEQDEFFTEITSNKGRFIEYAATLMAYYLKIVPKKRLPSLYKQAVIVGHLAASFGLVHDEETYLKSPSKTKHYTEYLYYQTLRICKKINEQVR